MITHLLVGDMRYPTLFEPGFSAMFPVYGLQDEFVIRFADGVEKGIDIGCRRMFRQRSLEGVGEQRLIQIIYTWRTVYNFPQPGGTGSRNGMYGNLIHGSDEGELLKERMRLAPAVPHQYVDHRQVRHKGGGSL